jgi:hypothetical protein
MVEMLNTVPLLEGPAILPSRANEKLSLPVVEGEANILNACHPRCTNSYTDEGRKKL